MGNVAANFSSPTSVPMREIVTSLAGGVARAVVHLLRAWGTGKVAGGLGEYNLSNRLP